MKKIITLLAACSLTLLVHAGGDKDKSCCAGKEKNKKESCTTNTVSASQTDAPKSCGAEGKSSGCCAGKKEAGNQKEKVAAPKEDTKVKKS